MALLGNYEFQSISEDEFEFSFDIPDNCGYTTNYDSVKKINTLSITLNSGQSQPSSTYKTEYETFNPTNGLLQVYFQQTVNGATLIKPKITVLTS